MASRDMSTRISVTGEREFSRAMSAAAGEVRTLEAEMKLAKAEFQATGNAEKYAATQSQILKAQIAAQKKAVEQAEAAIQQLTNQGVSPSSRAMQTWRAKLANAKTSLTQMETKLSTVESGLQGTTTEFGNAETAASGYQSQLEKIGGTIDTQAAIDSIDKITNAIENTVRVAARATKAIIGIASDAGKWADDIKTNSEQLGIDPETYQSWQYASQSIDTSVESIGKSWQDIGKKMKDGDTDFIASLATMGIAARDASGNLRTSGDIFWDAIDYLGSIDDEASQAAAATALFGNDWRQLMPLINAGSAAYKNLAQEGREVAVVSNENVEKLGKMDDAFHRTEFAFNKLKMDALAALAPTFERVADALARAIQSLDEFVQSEEGQAALQALGDALSGVINSFIGTDENGANGFQKLIEAATGAVNGLTSALNWITENSGTVAGALQLIGLGFGLLKVSSSVLTFMQLLKSTPLNKIGSMFGRGTNGGVNGGSGTGTGGGDAAKAMGGFGAKLSGLLSSGSTGANLLLTAGLPAAVVTAAVGISNAAHAQDAGNIHQRAEDMRTAAADAAETLGEGANEMRTAVEMAADALDITDQKAFDGSTILSDPKKVTDTLKELKQFAWLQDFLSPEKWQQLQAVGTDASTLGLGEEADLLQSIANVVIGQMEAEAAGETPKMRPEAELRHLVERGGMDDGDVDDLKDLQAWFVQDGDDGFTEEGKNAVKGFAQGITETTPEAVAAAAAMAQAVMDTVASIMDIHSPSRVMAKMGLFTGEGYAEGLAASTADVQRAMAGMLAIPGRGAVPGVAGSGYGAGASYSSSFYIDKYVQNTTEDARALARRVQDAEGWTRAGFGHRS